MIERMEAKVELNNNQEIIKKLEKLSLLLDSDRIDFLLVLLGEKPATDFGLSVRINSPEEKEFSEQKEMLKELLQESGLSFFPPKEEIKMVGDEPVIKEYYSIIARDIQNKKRLRRAFDQKDARETGLVFGFPPSAVEAFCKGGVMESDDDLSQEVRYGEAAHFLHFKLSKKHWPEEFEVVKRWANAIKENFPDFYKKYVDLRPKIDAMRVEDPERFKNLLNNREAMEAIKNRDPKLYEELMISG